MQAKLFIIVGLYVTNLFSAWGQVSSAYHFGVTGGINASQIAVPSLNHTTDLLGRYNLAATLEQRFTPAIALIYQLGYTRFGGSTTNTSSNGSFTSINEYNYLALPILLRIRLKTNRIFVDAGGQMNYYLAGRSYIKGKENQASTPLNITKLDAGLSGGLAYQLGKHILINVRYYHSLRKIYADHSGLDPTTGMAIYYRPTPEYFRVYSLNTSYYF